ncbi:hypothetical protein T05_11109 [Trichinella murrelli]|uniref:Uncharacterized protein n=1 Tax=Trichinella murrelli TaxID=144512 RepID=A0A0V0STC0_9BILA|nr:hypothetical protein T05_11109 [Trichinella murrelli]
MDPSGKDMVQAIQSDDFKFYESQWVKDFQWKCLKYWKSKC